MSNKHWVLDTNILVYLLNADSSQHNAAKNVIKQAQKENISLVITQQTIIELIQTLTKFYSVPLKTASQKTKQIIKSVNKIIHPLPQTINTYLKLCQQEVKPKSHFDLYLAATLITHKTKTLITNNPKDFNQIKQLKILPLSSF
ncbi:PIN domain-containing protein [Patescibacteria group bacterium]|nr:PIN domain-containing protein [Patescibacteria group bacterium]MBU1200018.1 PIN domain-containing protein [Patescibacteria group bacterium]MBU1256712.1 PIN domain-containing protein [Patescibacteria group bacterium]MBU1457435.1 PIN domain-containing protein [Patescibacteria group bacterium]